jgi:hypothetical protein
MVCQRPVVWIDPDQRGAAAAALWLGRWKAEAIRVLSPGAGCGTMSAERCTMRSMLESGDPASTILHAAEQPGAGTIVLGSRVMAR